MASCQSSYLSFSFPEPERKYQRGGLSHSVISRTHMTELIVVHPPPAEPG